MSKFSLIRSRRRMALHACKTSRRLWGGMLVAIPTAIPDDPFNNRSGNLLGKTFGSISLAVKCIVEWPNGSIDLRYIA
jgi:hypothetical protein